VVSSIGLQGAVFIARWIVSQIEFEKEAVMSLKRCIFAILAVAIMGLPAFGADKVIRIGLSQESLDHPFMITQRKQIIDGAAAYTQKTGIKVEVLATDGQGSVATQVAGIEDLLSKGVDILLVQAAKAEGLKEELAKVHQQGIPFLFVGKPIHGTDAVTLISMDNRLIGKQVGTYIVEQLKKKYGSAKGNIVVIEGITGDETSVNRVGGCLDAIKAYPGIKIVAQQPADYRMPQAVTVMENILQANGPHSIDVIFAANGDMALGAVQAVKDAGRKGEGMIIIGIDGSKQELEAIKAGDMTTTWQYRPCGIEGFDYAMKILNGEKVPPEVIPVSDQITKANVNKFQPAF
jgi:ribose transport system substrate-binding protein